MRSKTRVLVEMLVGLLVIAGSARAQPISITTCPFLITSPGRYLLAADLTCAGGDGITIKSSDVTLALEGHRITAGVGANRAIAVNPGTTIVPMLQNVRILGPGLITGGGGNTFAVGVLVYFLNHSEVSGVTVLGSSGSGIVAIRCDSLTITGNTLGRNGNPFGYGIVLSSVQSSTISRNDASGNGSGMTVDYTAPGASTPLGTVSNNIFNGNTYDGLGGDIIFGATIHNNVTNGNGGVGIAVGEAQLGLTEISNNTSLANGLWDLVDNDERFRQCAGHVWRDNKFFTANQSCIH
jgi:hypothetical protein